MFEAIVIGLMNILFFWALSPFTQNHLIKLVLSGALIHIIFEVLGLNEWWCKMMY